VRQKLRTADPVSVSRLREALRSTPSIRGNAQIASLVARLLVMRGTTSADEAERFLAPSLSHLHSPYLMAGMKAALDRLEAAIERKEPILIYGDYDVDGTTAIIILKTAIQLRGGVVDFHVPHRIRDGYDLRDDVIERAAASGVRLIVSVDMGIRAFAPAETARRLGVDLIVTDHHLPGPDGVPRALAVLNPNQPGCEYPCKSLCGAGVAFKLAQGLMESRPTAGDRSRLLTSFMKVVAIATIADAVPLTGENRVFARLGLEALREPVNPGLRALLEVAQLANRPLTCAEVAFRVAPRINAAGRMDVARDVVDLFAERDPERAREIAGRLDRLNSERQDEERRITEAIEARIAEDPTLRDAYCMVIDGDGWHRGVIGITATRVVERHRRPALVISRDGEQAHGSGRSIPAFHLLNAIESCRELFHRYGGHAHAVGFSLPAARVEELRARIDEYARARLTLADFDPVLNVDAELPLDQVTPELFQTLACLQPFGVGNPEPVFVAHSVRLLAPPRIMKEKHIRLKLACGSITEEKREALAELASPRCHPDGSALGRRDWKKSITYDALGWRMAERLQEEQLLPGDALDIAFTLDHNDHPDFGGLELSLRDFCRSEQSADPSLEAAAKDAPLAPFPAP
jgi:single-stranded-DNA-specific exonuclease